MNHTILEEGMRLFSTELETGPPINTGLSNLFFFFVDLKSQNCFFFSFKYSSSELNLIFFFNKFVLLEFNSAYCIDLSNYFNLF